MGDIRKNHAGNYGDTLPIAPIPISSCVPEASMRGLRENYGDTLPISLFPVANCATGARGL